MKRTEIIKVIEPQLTKKRFEHTIRVADTALKLAEINKVSKEEIETAALFHDYAKYRPLDEMKQIIIDNNLSKDLLDFHHELWHGPVASILVEKEYGITNKLIQDAIYYHTTGRAQMTKHDMVIFVADYIEPGRDIPGVELIRETAQTDLIKAAWMIAKNTVIYLMENNNTIYPDSFHTYNDLTRKVTGGNNLNE